MYVKICGIQHAEAAAAARDYGADLIGFVFAPSRRNIDPAAAAKIIRNVPQIGRVGVFVNSPLNEIEEIARLCQLDYVQLHGSESPEFCRQLTIPVIKAVSVTPAITAESLTRFPVAWLLLDTLADGQAGGTGQTFDWPLMRPIRQQLTTPLLVAGGLTANNVLEAMESLQPEGVDVSGGVETAGSKDSEKIRQFIEAVRRSKGEGKHAGKNNSC